MDVEGEVSPAEKELNETIQFRENLIERARKLVEITQSEKRVVGVIARELVNLQKDLRSWGIRCVEKIITWTLDNTPEDSVEPVQFLWDGEEYLCKMLDDLNFVRDELNDNIRLRCSFEYDDPLFIKSKNFDNAADYRKGLSATFVILDAWARYEIRNPRSRKSRGKNLLPTTFAKQGSSKDRADFMEMKKKTRHVKRGAMHDIYDFNARTKRNSLQVTKDTVVFRGTMLYQRGAVLGQGAYAKVYECERQDGREFAVKCYDFAVDDKKESDDTRYKKHCFQRELEFLKTLPHPCIVSYEETIVHGGAPFMVIEKMSCTLRELQIDRSKEFVNSFEYSQVEQKAIEILVQLSDALNYLHDQNVIHRDIKPDNILLTPTALGIEAKIGDLGSARRLLTASFSERMKSDLSHYVGSRKYRAPEILGGGTDYGFEIDTWSLGCTMAEFIIGEPLFNGETEQEVLDSILSCFYFSEFPPNLERIMASRGLAVNEKLEKRSIIGALGSVSGLTQTIRSMIRLNRESRFSAKDTLRDVKELLIEVENAKKVKEEDDKLLKKKKE